MYQNLRQAGAASSEQTALPTGLQVGLGTRAVATARNFSQGNLQQSCEPARRRRSAATASSRSSCPTAPPATPATARSRSARPASSSPTTATPCSRASRFPPTAQSVTIGNDGTVSVVLPGQALPPTVGQLQLASFVNPGRPRAQGAEHLRRDRGLGHAERRHAGAERPRHRAAGLRRDLERQRRRGAGADDPDAARLRAQLEGDPDLRPDAAEAGPAVRAADDR